MQEEWNYKLKNKKAGNTSNNSLAQLDRASRLLMLNREGHWFNLSC
jgi:hypothetical protein